MNITSQKGPGRYLMPKAPRGSVQEEVLEHGLVKTYKAVVLPWDAEPTVPSIGAVGWALFLASVS